MNTPPPKLSIRHKYVEALQKGLQQLLSSLEMTFRGLEFKTYISNNRQFITNYGERYRNGERIATGFVESTVNQVIV